jgi:hypothetical protein
MRLISHTSVVATFSRTVTSRFFVRRTATFWNWYDISTKEEIFVKIKNNLLIA